MWPQPDTLRLHLRERSPPPATTATSNTTTTASAVASACVTKTSHTVSKATAPNGSPAAKTTAAVPTSATTTATTKCTTTTTTTTSTSTVTKTTVVPPGTTKCTSAHQMHSHNTSPHFRLTPPFSSPTIFIHNTSSTRSTTTTTSSSRTTPTNTTAAATTTCPTRSTSTTSGTTHLSPWTGSSTFTASSSHKKNSPNADSRLVVLGAPAVGKSALVVRLLTGRFIWEYDPTLEAAYRHHTTIDDDTAVMDILDTAGQEDGTNVGDAHARWGDGFVLVFSLTDRRSFGAIAAIHATLAAAKQTPNFSCVIVANKIDLGHLAEVNEDEASELAAELGASLFLTSACDGGPAIQAAFSELHRDVVRRRWTRRRRSSAKTVIEGFYKMFSR